MTLHDLKKRVDEATGPDQELDEAIARTLGGDDLYNAVCATHWPTLTASLDAALALVERVLPGWNQSNGRLVWTHGLKGERVWVADFSFWRIKVQAATPALAMISALLAALIGQEPSDV